MALKSENGFSLVEVIIAVTVGAILLAASAPMLSSAFRRSNADGAAQLIAQQLNYAHALALGSHADVLVQFDSAASTVVVAPGTGSARGPFPFSLGIKLMTAAPSPDTPDALGSQRLGTGTLQQMTFRDNGSVVGDPATNNLLSGTFFLEHTSADAATRRAVTLLGGTSRIHTYRWDPTTSTWK